jgi:hypothetical protein
MPVHEDINYFGSGRPIHTGRKRTHGLPKDNGGTLNGGHA